MTYILNDHKLRKANKKLLKKIHEHLGIKKSELSSNQLLQFISQSFFLKPYEEVKETILSDKPNKNNPNVYKKIENERFRIFILRYENQVVVTLDGVFNFSYLFEEDNIDFIMSEVSNLQKSCNCLSKEVFLPQILDDFDKIDESNIIQIAKDMGYFDYPETIFDMIEKYNVFINGELTQFGLDDQWMNEIVSEYDESGDIGDYVIWHPEIGFDKDSNYKEFFFSFNDLCKAKKESDGNWLINELGNDKKTYVIEFRSKKNIQ